MEQVGTRNLAAQNSSGQNLRIGVSQEHANSFYIFKLWQNKLTEPKTGGLRSSVAQASAGGERERRKPKLQTKNQLSSNFGSRCTHQKTLSQKTQRVCYQMGSLSTGLSEKQTVEFLAFPMHLLAHNWKPTRERRWTENRPAAAKWLEMPIPCRCRIKKHVTVSSKAVGAATPRTT